MIINLLVMALIVAIVIPASFAASFPRATIQIFEGLRLYRKGSLKYELIDYVDSSGYHKRKASYKYKNKKKYVRTETFRLMLWFFLLSLPFCTSLSLIAYLILDK